MHDRQPREEAPAPIDPLLESCGGAGLACLNRLFLTFAGIAGFGVALFGFLALEIWALSRIGFLTETASVAKYLLLIGLLLGGILLFFALWQVGYDWLRERRDKSGDHIFERLARFLDAWFRNLDWCANRNRWDILGAERFFVLPGHSVKPTVVAMLLAAFLVLGPRLPPVVEGALSYGLVVAGIVGILVVNRWWRPARFQFVPHLAVLGLVSAVAFFWPHVAGVRVIDSGPVRHFLIPAFWMFAAGLAVAAFLGPLLLRKYAGRVTTTTGGGKVVPGDADVSSAADSQPPATLGARQTGCAQPLDLPGQHDSLGIDWKRFARSLVKAPVFHLVEILYWPSLAVVFVANLETMGRVAFFLGMAAWVVYALGETHEELNNFLSNLKRALFRGPQLLVGLLIIVIAAGRLFDNSYIRTLVEGEGLVDPTNTWVLLDYLLGWTNNWVLLNYLASAYLLSWYFGYWVRAEWH